MFTAALLTTAKTREAIEMSSSRRINCSTSRQEHVSANKKRAIKSREDMENIKCILLSKRSKVKILQLYENPEKAKLQMQQEDQCLPRGWRCTVWGRRDEQAEHRGFQGGIVVFLDAIMAERVPLDICPNP